MAGAHWWGLEAGSSYQVSLRGSSQSIGQAQTANSEGIIVLPVEVTSAVTIPDDIGKEACVYSAAGSSVACCTITDGKPEPPIIEMNQDDIDDNPILSSNQMLGSLDAPTGRVSPEEHAREGIPDYRRRSSRNDRLLADVPIDQN